MPDPHPYAFVVAVVGDPDVMCVDHLRRLIEVLVTRHRSGRRIVLLAAGGSGPELEWGHELGWSIRLEPRLGSEVKQDCAIVATSDAVVVLGDPEPWSRLLALAREAKIPTRVYRTCPRLPLERPEWP